MAKDNESSCMDIGGSGAPDGARVPRQPAPEIDELAEFIGRTRANAMLQAPPHDELYD